MSEMIDLKQIEQHFNAANEAAEKSSKMARGAVIEAIEAGDELNKAKDCVPHGEWRTWLGKHWNYSQNKAIRYMALANSPCVMNLKDAESINEALRMIADSKPETVPRSERKPADVVVSIPDDEPDDEPDDDPTPDPPTQRKTAKGSEKVSEEKKPKTAAITPEILPDEPKPQKNWPEVSLEDLIEGVIAKLDHENQRKAAAKTLRKLADKLDPPTSISEETENDNETEKPRNPESCLGPNGRPRVQKVKFRYIQP